MKTDYYKVIKSFSILKPISEYEVNFRFCLKNKSINSFTNKALRFRKNDEVLIGYDFDNNIVILSRFWCWLSKEEIKDKLVFARHFTK